MLDYIKNKLVKITTVSLIFVIVFTFIHSELDQLSNIEDDHDAHDYCELVKDTSLQLTKTSNELIKLKLGKSLYLHSDDIITITTNFSKKIELKQYYTPQKTSKTYIYNDSFLI